MSIPFDRKSRHSRFFGQNAPSYLLDDGLCWRICVESFIGIFVVDIVPNANEFAVVVRAGEQDDSDAHDLRVRNLGKVGCICFEQEFVDTNWDRSDEK